MGNGAEDDDERVRQPTLVVLSEIRRDLNELTEQFKEFRVDYEPFLMQGKKSADSKEALVNELIKDITKWGVLGFVAVVVAAIWEYALKHVFAFSK